MTEIIVGVAAFTSIVLLLTLFVLGARKLLVPSGSCEITINDRLTVQAGIGQRLLQVLNDAGANLPGACGGAGTCGLCKARVIDEDSAPGPQERALLSRSEAAHGVRLACQVPILHPIRVEVDDDSFGVKNWVCTVESVRIVSTLIREIVLRLPEDAGFDFRAGSFVQISCTPYQLDFSDIEIDPPYRTLWDRSNLWSLSARTDIAVTRAYSLANRPSDQGLIRLNIRIALPPPQSRNIAPGIVSSWLFSLKPGSDVEVAGPYGHFEVESAETEAVFIGGGVGMAPLYAQIMDLLERQHSKRKLSFWYGARSKRELYYVEDFERLQQQHENFSWHVALSDPESEDKWQGATGFIHQTVFEQYLESHPSPEDCQYYLCGPPLMVKAVYAMLENLGVDADNIHYDDFGGG